LTSDRVLYSPERLASIAAEAAKDNSVFSLDDRMGLAYDALALSKAGLSELSSSLTLIDLWKNEKECQHPPPPEWLFVLIGLTFFCCIDLVWQAIANSIDDLTSTWWEHPQIVGKLNAFSRVSSVHVHTSTRQLMYLNSVVAICSVSGKARVRVSCRRITRHDAVAYARGQTGRGCRR